MKQIQHVRFSLSNLIDAVKQAKGLSARPPVQEALSYYWNWAIHRGWELVAVTNQMDPRQAILNLENTPQLEIRHEEFWNVIWRGEDTDGSCNLVEETGVALQDNSLVSQVFFQLEQEGFERSNKGTHYSFVRGSTEIHPLDIVNACTEDDHSLDAKELAEQLVEEFENV
jgi:hypothetical protein